MQESLFSLSESVRSSVLWCRPVIGTSTLFAIGFSRSCSSEVIEQLSQLVEIKAFETMRLGNTAFLIKVPVSLLGTVRSLPQPRGGSRHESNDLPW